MAGERKRDNMGRFLPSGPTGAGRTVREGRLPAELREYADRSIPALWALAEDPDTPRKTRALLYQWFAEMVYGKPSQGVALDQELEGELTLRFEGELEQWSQ